MRLNRSKIKTSISNLFKNSKLQWIIFAGLILLYFVKAIRIAFTTWVGMDEGYYLIKGYWFLTGEQIPFTINGAITNKPPFAFLIPGLSQLIAPGVLSGRIFAILITLASLIGLWLIIRRNSTGWWANLALLSITLNDFWIETYTREYSQTLTVFFLIWSLYFSLGKERSKGQIALGGIMAIMTLLVRQNMAPYFALFALYIAWEHNLKKAVVLLIPGILVFVIVHIYYWPNIFLNLWAIALPEAYRLRVLEIVGLDDLFRVIAAEGRNTISYSAWQIAHAASRLIKTSFLAMFIAFVSNFLLGFIWNADQKRAKEHIFIILSFDVLLVTHLNVVTDLQVLLFNLPVYLLFWAPVIYILLPIVFQAVGHPGKNWIARAFLPLSMTFFFGLIGLGYQAKISPILMNIGVPRFNEGRFQQGTTEFWRLLVNKFSLDPKIQAYLLPTLFGVAVGAVAVVIIYLISKLVNHIYRIPSRQGMFAVLLVGFLFISTLPTIPREPPNKTCEVNTIEALRKAGLTIRSQVDSDSLLFWGVENQPVIGALFYFGDVRIFPEQLNGKHYYRRNLSLEESLKSRYWSDAQAVEWLKQADYLIGEPGKTDHWLELIENIPGLSAVQLEGAPPMNPCSENSRILLYQLQKE